jgi:integrase
MIENQAFLCDEWFHAGREELAQARLKLTELRGAHHAPRTIQAYAADWTHFDNWCKQAGRVSFPSDPETISLYLSACIDKAKVATLDRRVSAIVSRHVRAGLASPATPTVRDVLAAIHRRNRRGISRKAAITIDELVMVCNVLAETDTVRSLRNRAAILFGFAAALRRSEVSALDLADIDLREEHVSITLRRSKTDQLGKGRVLVIPRAKRAVVCVVRALHEWMKERGDWPGALFCDVTIGSDSPLENTRMADHIIYWALREAARKSGLDHKSFGAHSLRAGAATCAAEAGANVFEIMELTGHKSADMLARYVRPATVRYPLRKVL